MNTAVGARPQQRPAEARDGGRPAADVFVIFGITGDLAKVMTFDSLYRLERRGLLSCPIVGVAANDWSVEELRNHTRTAIEACGEGIDEDVFARFAARLSYVSGDFGDQTPYERLARAVGDARTTVFYLEIPPFLFGPVIKGLSEAGLTKTGRVVVEKPFGHDLASARALAEEIHQYIDRHYVSCVQITIAESFGVEDRGHFYDPVGALRDVVVNHLMQVVAAAAMEPPSSGEADVFKDALVSVYSRVPEPSQLVVKLDPTTGVRMLVEAQRHETAEPEQINMDMEFAAEGGERCWRVMQPLLDNPPPVHPYAKGSWGPEAADGVLAGYGSWHEPWVAS